MSDQSKPVKTGEIHLKAVRISAFAVPPTVVVEFRIGDEDAQLEVRMDQFESFERFRSFLLGWGCYWPTLPPGADWGQLVAEACVRGAVPVA